MNAGPPEALPESLRALAKAVWTETSPGSWDQLPQAAALNITSVVAQQPPRSSLSALAAAALSTQSLQPSPMRGTSQQEAAPAAAPQEQLPRGLHGQLSAQMGSVLASVRTLTQEAGFLGQRMLSLEQQLSARLVAVEQFLGIVPPVPVAAGR